MAVEKASDLLIVKENTVNPYSDTIFQGQQLLGSVDGNSESQPLRPTRDRYDSRCNSDDFAVGVKNRTAAVTGVDGGVGLDELGQDSAVIKPVKLSETADMSN